MNIINEKITTWYKKNSRDLPWRNTSDPYRIWVSEVILQQTRIEQGRDYYYRFLDAFPSITALATATQDQVLKAWQGLGYYSRARNMQKAAQQIINHYDGKIPTEYKHLLKLKGIGPYTAGAIASIAFNKPVPAIDGNAFRVLSRLFADNTPINTSSAYKHYTQLITPILSTSAPSDFNQGLIELGALICKPNPNCEQCPIREHCLAFAEDKQTQLPIKRKKKAIKNRHLHYLNISVGENTFVEQRRGGDIWQGLHQFPLIETSKPTPAEKLMQLPEWKKLFPSDTQIEVHPSPIFKHQLTHQLLHVRFYKIVLSIPSDYLTQNFTKIARSQLDSLAIPRLIEKYLRT